MVKDAIANRPTSGNATLTRVVVDGFWVTLTFKARRMTYDMRALYDPAADRWTLYDQPGPNNNLRIIIGHVIDAMKKD